MRLPDNWNNIKGAGYGSYRAITPGGYVCQIVNAEEKYSQKGRHMLVIYFDIFEGEFKDFYKQQYNSSTYAEKKWRGIYNQLTEEKSEEYFKGMIESIQKSNNGFVFTGNEIELKGKLFGGIFGEEEYKKQDGSISSITKLMGIIPADRIKNDEFKIPEKKLLKNEQKQQQPYFSTTTAVNDDDDLPF